MPRVIVMYSSCYIRKEVKGLYYSKGFVCYVHILHGESVHLNVMRSVALYIYAENISVLDMCSIK